MTVPLPKAKPYTLDCQHVVWLRHPPVLTDSLWCIRCRRYEPLFMVHARDGGEWYSPNGEYKASRIRKRFHGECLFQGCTYQYDAYSNFNALDKEMHSHYMRSHTKWTVQIKKAARLPPESQPPF